MKLEDVQPGHCFARAQHLLGDVILIREELGRSVDARPLPEISGAEPREVYFEALVAWRKVQRLCTELGVQGARSAPSAPPLASIKPGHVLELLDAVVATVDALKQRLAIPETCTEPAFEASRKPSDVLATVLRVNRELSRGLERPFTPTDVYRVVSLASTYATRLGGVADTAPFERRRRPADCYARLTVCLAKVNELITQRGGKALAARGAPEEVVPGDVYDLANLVLGELAFLHAMAPDAAFVHAFEPVSGGHVLPAHVDQLARTLEAQVGAIR